MPKKIIGRINNERDQTSNQGTSQSQDKSVEHAAEPHDTEGMRKSRYIGRINNEQKREKPTK